MKKLILYSILLSIIFNQTVISGFITNKDTGETLIGANIFIPEIETGITSDKNGFYSILIEETELKEFEIVIQYLGYNTINEKINEKKITKSDHLLSHLNLRLDFELIPTNIELKSTEIIAEKEARQTATPYSSIKITQSQLSAIPSLAEADIFRTLQGLPGVLQSSEFSTGLIIRGGNTDQNLILLDGITVYNPSHLGGIFSNFIVIIIDF